MYELNGLKIKVAKPVLEIIKVLNEAGYEAYIVGGCVRDLVLGRKPKDWDITTSALPLQVKSLFSNCVDTGIEHGTVMVIKNAVGYEVTTYRVDGEYVCGWAVEKMSKSMFNVVNPDVVCDTYGADTLRLYEMFLGPLEQSKPWDTKGIDGVNRFLKKFWRLFYDRDNLLVEDSKATAEELKSLHKLIAKEQEDIEAFSYNTTISAFMIAVNELTALKCSKREILEPLVILLSPFAPHIAEELWSRLGHEDTVTFASFPEFNPAYVVEDKCTYPVSFNGKTRFSVELPKSSSPAEVEAYVRGLEQTARYVGELHIVKVIVVPGRIINIVVK